MNPFKDGLKALSRFFAEIETPTEVPMKSELDNYRVFIQKKAAPPRRLGIDDFELIHLGLGLATEALELQASTTADNTEEELGDLLWYLSYGAGLLEIPSPTLELVYEKSKWKPSSNTLPQKELLRHVEEFVSLIKKVVIYGQALPIERDYLRTWLHFCILVKACDHTLSELIASNRTKLNQRYLDKFTKEESAQRKDKV